MVLIRRVCASSSSITATAISIMVWIRSATLTSTIGTPTSPWWSPRRSWRVSACVPWTKSLWTTKGQSVTIYRGEVAEPSAYWDNIFSLGPALIYQPVLQTILRALGRRSPRARDAFPSHGVATVTRTARTSRTRWDARTADLISSSAFPVNASVHVQTVLFLRLPLFRPRRNK